MDHRLPELVPVVARAVARADLHDEATGGPRQDKVRGVGGIDQQLRLGLSPQTRKSTITVGMHARMLERVTFKEENARSRLLP